MPQRTYDEINAEVKQAISVSDAETLLTLAAEMEALGTPKAMAAAANARGTASMWCGEYAVALEQFGLALGIFTDLDDGASVAIITSNIGIVYTFLGDNPTALEHYLRGLAIHEELDDRLNMAVSMGNIGNVYYSMGDYPATLEHYYRAMSLHEELRDRAGVARVTGNIGLVCGNTGDYTTSLKHHRASLALYEEIGDRRGVAIATGNIGSMLAASGDGVAGVEQLRLALTLLEELGDRARLVHVSSMLMHVLMNLDRYAEAEDLLEHVGAMQIDDPGTRSLYFMNRALLAERQQELATAQQHLKTALSIASDAGLRNNAAAMHERLRDLAQKRNDFAGFIEHNAEYLRITEEIRGKEATQRLTMMEAERKMEAELRARDKERALLYGALPKPVADRMIRGEDVSGDHFDHAAVMFLDIVGFTSNTSTMPPAEVVKLLEHIFSTIDGICDTHNVVKIKTIGDSYMCFRGDADVSTNAISIARVGIEAMQVASGVASGVAFMWPLGGRIQFRIGVHIGTATAGVIGTQRLQYDVWGDTVNVASRLEGTSEPGRIHVSEAFAHVLRSSSDSAPYNLIQRGEVEIKGKGAMQTYWLENSP